MQQFAVVIFLKKVQYKTIVKFGFGDIWNNQGLGLARPWYIYHTNLI